ncbi:MAG: hypothetical protein QXU32_00020 [Nitrososphaerales archaeon]
MAVKWFEAEDYSEKAEAAKDDQLKVKVTLVAPAFMIFELLNAFRHIRSLVLRMFQKP